MIGIGIGSHLGPGVSPVSPETRWILNADTSQLFGVTYSWDDTQAWTDANAWKD